MIDLAHTVLNERVSVLINVVLTLKKKKKMVRNIVSMLVYKT